jgi:tRNA A37 threonylcarbamoyladenosine modification protein TsaB
LLCKAVLHMAQPVDLVAVGIGPGSYTGIRVGAALGKALAYGWGVPLVGFCSLKAFGSPPVLVDARGAGIYALLEEEPVLLAPTDPRLQELGRAISPNPEAIKKRLPIEVEEKGPNPMWLAEVVWRQFLEKGAGALELNYASFP